MEGGLEQRFPTPFPAANYGSTVANYGSTVANYGSMEANYGVTVANYRTLWEALETSGRVYIKKNS